VVVLTILWSGKPFLKKTVVKFIIIFAAITMLLSFIFIYIPLLAPFWLAFSFIYFILYYFNKKAYTYLITDKSIRIEKSWVFGNYVREVTFDQIQDVHIMQGILARHFNCGSLAFVTSTGLEVGYVGGGAAAGRGVAVGSGAVTPTLIKGRGNMFWDTSEPGNVRELLVSKLAEWREVFQQQRIASSVENIAVSMGKMARALRTPRRGSPRASKLWCATLIRARTVVSCAWGLLEAC
jgi:membrane protein YdbS with pleckstrin-like domain